MGKNRIEIIISKTEDGSVSVEANAAEGVTDEEVGELAMDFINALWEKVPNKVEF